MAIIAAKLGARHVYAVDKSPDVIEVGRANAEANRVSDRVSFYCGDLFEPLDRSIRANVIIGDVSGIPDALADESGWFPTKGGGGARGSELPIRMLEEARRRLASGGRSAAAHRTPCRTKARSSRPPRAYTRGFASSPSVASRYRRGSLPARY